jgi:hypothetical protein
MCTGTPAASKSAACICRIRIVGNFVPATNVRNSRLRESGRSGTPSALMNRGLASFGAGRS